MTKWFDTNYHYIVPELHADTAFSLDASRLLAQLAEAKEQGVKARPVIIGPVTYLALGKTHDGSDRLALLPRRAVVINVGRGTTVDQAALETALRNGTISAAGIDVTDPEPLPADSTLWNAPNLLLTPHAAGGRVVGAVERIIANAAVVEATPPGEPITGLEALVR